MRLIVWGTYDTGKPRVRILLRGLREAGVDVTEIHTPIWESVEDKGTLGKGRAFGFGLRVLAAYPGLIWRLMRAPKADAILVSYPGHLDVFVIWVFAKLRGMPVVWDVFLSAYNTVVEDRGKLATGSVSAKLLGWFEKRAVRSVTRAFMDTRTHADYLATRAGLPQGGVGHVSVGVEPENFPPKVTIKKETNDQVDVLFYGQFIPLHGVATIIEAARLDISARIRWTLIGKGQMEQDVRAMLESHPLETVNWLPWVKYEDLIAHIEAADVCLGVFGTSDKAGRVIPNKVYQILSAGKPLVTRISSDLGALLGEVKAVQYVPPGDAEALLNAILDLKDSLKGQSGPHHETVWPKITPLAVGHEAKAEIEAALKD